MRKSILLNLFDSHPPFQIDGNFGVVAAITEMLFQSQNGEINLLPVFPAQWEDGSIHGLKARAACTVDIGWKGGKLTNVSVKSDHGGSVKIRYKETMKLLKLKAGERVQLDGLLN